jgi:L-ascorbate metabolism protein UlaG (beta-lactamase superfamily)
MQKSLFFGVVAVMTFAVPGLTQSLPEDFLPTSAGDLKITFIGHASLMFTFDDKIIHVDPVMAQGDYTKLPKADVVLVTHEHGDHLDPEALRAVLTEDTRLVLPEKCAQNITGGIVMNNGDKKTVEGIEIEAVPAYNVDPERPFHPKGDGNGYVIAFADKRIYVAGDTENIQEMKALEKIDVAFLPMNMPFTMTPEMVADAAKAFRPRILYPYHFGGTDTLELTALLEGEKDIEVRIRKMGY